VWFFFISPVQQPLAISLFGDGGGGGGGMTWGYRGLVALPSFPVTWLIADNYPIVGMGTYGAPDITTAAGGTITGDLAHGGYITVNWAGVQVPDGHWGVSTQWVVRGGLGVGLPLVAYTLYSYYMPFGAFDLLAPNRKEQSAAIPSAIQFWNDYGGPPANVWELTGIAQPPLLDPKKIWDPVTNPHKQPSLKLAKQVVEKFRDNWNATASDLNARAAACDQAGGVPGYPNSPPPVWNWALPYGGDTLATAVMFSNGWVPAAIEQVTVPITVPTLGVGQLDPKVWDVSPVLSIYQNPPVPWSWTSYTLTTYTQNPLDQAAYDLELTLATA
jgi:hypothetical protein